MEKLKVEKMTILFLCLTIEFFQSTESFLFGKMFLFLIFLLFIFGKVKIYMYEASITRHIVGGLLNTYCVMKFENM